MLTSASINSLLYYLMAKKKSDNASVFARRLTELRKGRQLTQVELAEKLGLSRGVISYYESASKNPTFETIHKFADFFAVSPNELMEEADVSAKKPGPISRLEQQLERIKRLSPHKQRMISEIIEATLKTQ